MNDISIENQSNNVPSQSTPTAGFQALVTKFIGSQGAIIDYGRSIDRGGDCVRIICLVICKNGDRISDNIVYGVTFYYRGGESS